MKKNSSRKLFMQFMLSSSVFLTSNLNANIISQKKHSILQLIDEDTRKDITYATVVNINDTFYLKAKMTFQGKNYEMAFDENGEIFDITELDQLYKNFLRSKGNIAENLLKEIKKEPLRIYKVAIWLSGLSMPIVEKPESLLPGEDIDKVLNGIMQTHTANTTKFYQEKLAKMSAIGLSPMRLIFDDHSVPMVVVELTGKEVTSIAQSSHVAAVELYSQEKDVDLTEAMVMHNVRLLHNNHKLTGKRIRIGVWEPYCADTINQLVVAESFVRNCEEVGRRDHTRFVAGIINNQISGGSVAPDSRLYLADNGEYNSLKWAIVDRRSAIVNQSFHERQEQLSGELSGSDKLKDYYVINPPYPLIVQAAGNFVNNQSPSNAGTSLETEFVNHKGYNSINVGSHDISRTKMADSSIFKNPNSIHNDRELPEISARGTNLIIFNSRKSGTSFSAPIVAGSAALLMEENRILTIWPEGLRALFFAGATVNIPNHPGTLQSGSQVPQATGNWFDDIKNGKDSYDGAGSLDIGESLKIVKNRWNRVTPNIQLSSGWDIGRINFSSFANNSYATREYKFTVPLSGTNKNVKVALAWNSTATNNKESGLYNRLDYDLDIEIFDAQGRVVSRSNTRDNSYEIADFKGEAGSTYTIKIYRNSPRTSEGTWFGIAWNVY